MQFHRFKPFEGEKFGVFFSCINQTDSFASGLIVARLVWAMTT